MKRWVKTMGKNINNVYVSQVRLFPADGPPTGDPFNGERLVLAEGSKGERSVGEGPAQRAPFVNISTAKEANSRINQKEVQWLGQLIRK